jgi:hypothetical protein
MGVAVVSAAAFVGAQAPPAKGPLQQGPPSANKVTPPIEKLGEQRFRMGQVFIDTAAREISVAGRMNEVSVLEFIANTRNGMKAYESAMTLETDAITFNAALLLIGLDRAHAQPPTQHFDPAQPKGDAVEIWVEGVGPSAKRIRAERLVYDKVTKETLPDGPWVYTGSTFVKIPDAPPRYLAETDGVLIGFIHSPAPIIEHPRGAGIRQYGNVILNPTIGLLPGMPVKLTVKAIDKPAAAQR